MHWHGRARLMTYFATLWLFGVLVAGIIVVPGMDMMFVLARALAGGWRAGVAATLGIMAGGMAHTVIGALAAAGLSRVMPAIAWPMLVIGSAYMAWIGVSLMRSRVTVGDVGPVRLRSFWGIGAQGLMTCLMNPKAWMFVMAVYPQFLAPGFGPIWPQAVVLGVITVTVQAVVYGGLALAAARGRDVLVSSPALTIWTGRAAGAVLVVAAVCAGWAALGGGL